MDMPPNVWPLHHETCDIQLDRFGIDLKAEMTAKEVWKLAFSFARHGCQTPSDADEQRGH